MTRSARTTRFAPGLAFVRAALLLMAAGCDQPAGSGASAPDQMLVVSGDDQVAFIGEDLPEAVAVRVVDRHGRPVAGHPVGFVVLSGGGSVVAEAASTDADGRVTARWKLGTVAGQQVVEARIANGQGGLLLSVAAHALARGGPPAVITAVGPTDLGTDTLVADSLAVRVTDGWGNPAPEAEVHWYTQSGTVSPSVSITDSAGIARTYWTVPPRIATRTDSIPLTATGGIGGLVGTEFKATLERLPLLFTITSPADGTVLRTPRVRITAACARCGRFSVRIGGQALYDGLAAAFDSVVEFTGDGARIEFGYGRDQNVDDGRLRYVSVQNHPAWREIGTAGSRVRDYEPGRLLFTIDTLTFWRPGDIIQLRERSLETGGERLLRTFQDILSVRLTSRGAFIHYRYSIGPMHWGESLEEVSGATAFGLFPYQLVAITRRWVLYQRYFPLELWVHDFADGSDVLISSGYASGSGNVTDNGDVVYGASERIFRYRGGATTELGSGTAPRTDGTKVVWLASEGAQTYRLVMHDGTGEHVVAAGLASVPVYAIENGWIVYSATDAGGQLRLYRRAPGGATTPVATLSSAWRLLGLGPNGAVAVSDNGRWYVVRPDGTHSDIGKALGWAKWVGERLIAGLGNTLFEIDY
jgi:hypothetical protein